MNRVFPAILALAILATGLAGCFVEEPAQIAKPQDARIVDGLLFQRFGSHEGYVYEVASAAGSLSYFRPANASATVTLPENSLRFDAGTGRFSLEREVAVSQGDVVTFLPSPGVYSLEFDVRGPEGRVIVIAENPDLGKQIVSGEWMYALLEAQRDNFPHRTPGHINYVKSQAYFAEYFKNLGMEVEVDPYGTNALNGLPGDPILGLRGNSVANVVAYKAGTANPPKYLLFGGHYDVVSNTVEGAFDNTAGTVATMELARVFANVTTEHTLVFGLWGGEEDGILGSRFWVHTNPEKVARMTASFNLDVFGMAYPGPVGNPDPVVITAGPDGRAGDELLGFGKEILDRWMNYDASFFRFEPWAYGQAQGSGVNAQSDHSSFITAGVPSYFVFAGNIANVFRIIHKPADTVHNMTLYMLGEDITSDVKVTPEEWEVGKTFTARSFETQLWFPFYLAVLTDLGYFSPSITGETGSVTARAPLPLNV